MQIFEEKAAASMVKDYRKTIDRLRKYAVLSVSMKKEKKWKSAEYEFNLDFVFEEHSISDWIGFTSNYINIKTFYIREIDWSLFAFR